MTIVTTTLNDPARDKNGVVTVALALNALLETEGHRVCVVTPANGASLPALAGARICRFLRRAAASTGLSFLYFCNLKLTTFVIARRLASLPSPPDLVIAHDALTAGAALRATKRRVAVLLLCHFGTEPWLEFSNAGLLQEGSLGFRLLRKAMRAVLADPGVELVAVSRRNAALLRAIVPGDAAERIHVAYTGVSLPEGTETRSARCADEPPVVVNVGRLDEWKNQRVLPDVAAELNKRGFRCRFVLVGPDVGGEAARILARAEQRGVADWFTFTGPLARDRALDEVRCADLYLHTSRLESFGLTLVEAMAAGTPVAALEYDTLGELLPDTPEAVIPADATPAAIAGAISWLLADRTRLADVRARQRAVYEARFSPQAFRTGYVALIDRAVRRRTAA